MFKFYHKFNFFSLVHKDLIKISKDICTDIIKNETECDGMIGLMGDLAVNNFIKHNYDYRFK